MPKFLVRQRRPAWVCLVQEIEAENEEAAEEKFLTGFDPQHAFVEGYVKFAEFGPIAVFKAWDFPNIEDVKEAD